MAVRRSSQSFSRRCIACNCNGRVWWATQQLNNLNVRTSAASLDIQVELGNDLRAEVRAEASGLGAVPGQRKQLLEAALRALVAENRRLQGELLEAGQTPASSAPATSGREDRRSGVTQVESQLPSSSSLRPVSRGMADRGSGREASGSSGQGGKQASETSGGGTEALMLQGIAAPCGASCTLPVSAPGYLRQPLSDDIRLPRSATDRGTESQRKALERLKAAQAKHDEVAAAAAEQRQKVLPLIQWRDTATAAAAER
eukprot:symbB.v1.2.012812.t1/scaffold884.1/size313170/24